MYRVSCSKGTYIRTLCEMIAEQLGTVGYMKELRRTKVDDFCIDDCVTLSDLEVATDKNIYVKSIENVFNDKDSIVLNNRKTELFFNGVMLTFEKEDGLYKVYNSGEFLGLGIIKNKLLKRDVIVR